MDISTLKARKSEQGFTLVELAVVMIIIGLLIGGILKGQELITNARVTTTASEMESFTAAYNGFRDQYNAIPGDMNNAVARIADCAAIAACQNGGGNGTLAIAVGAAAGNDESVFFFGQLLAASLISGMDGTNNGAAPAIGVTNPTSPIGGAYTVGDTRTGLNALYNDTTPRGGIHIVLSSGTGGAAANSGAMTIGQAANIDRRLDDGNPVTGLMFGQNDCNDGGAPAIYDEADQTTTCSVAYRL